MFLGICVQTFSHVLTAWKLGCTDLDVPGRSKGMAVHKEDGLVRGALNESPNYLSDFEFERKPNLQITKQKRPTKMLKKAK